MTSGWTFELGAYRSPNALNEVARHEPIQVLFETLGRKRTSQRNADTPHLNDTLNARVRVCAAAAQRDSACAVWARVSILIDRFRRPSRQPLGDAPARAGERPAR